MFKLQKDESSDSFKKLEKSNDDMKELKFWEMEGYRPTDMMMAWKTGKECIRKMIIKEERKARLNVDKKSAPSKISF